MPAPSNPVDTVALREKITLRLDDGTLPAAGNQKIYGGYGTRQPCAACDASVLETEVLYEVEVQLETDIIVMTMHRRCFDIWMEESLLLRRRKL